MSLPARIRSWWKALAHRERTESELEAELSFHMEASAEDLMRGGMTRDAAMRQLRLELGSAAAHKERWRLAVGLRSWDDFRADLRYSARQLRRSPAFTLTVLLVLALGIGANAAMFSIVDATLLRWLPYSRPNELVTISAEDSKGRPTWASFADVEVWQQRSQTLASLGYYYPGSAYLKSPAGEQLVDSTQVSANLFTVLGVQPAMGRGFTADEQVPGKGSVVVLSHAVWRNMFQSDPAIVGKQVTLRGLPQTVVGVMPPSFVFPAEGKEPQIWVPIEITEKHHVRDFSTGPPDVIARIRKELGTAAATAELTTIQQALAPLYTIGKGEFAPSRVKLTGYRESLTKDARPALIALLAAVAVIWLIACANVANLMLARGMARQREIAVRGALGASQWRIVRQLFTESLLLSAIGTLAGIALAQIALLVFNKTLSAKLDLPEHLAPNLPVLGALLGLTVLSAMLFGLLPAWLAARTPLEHSLRQGTSQAGASRNRHRLQKVMMVAEIGLSLVLLISCGLLLRTVFALRHVPLGFRTEHVLIVQPKFPKYKYRGQDISRAVYKPLLERVQQMNGVMAASLTTIVPLHKGFDSQLVLYDDHDGKSSVPPTRVEAKMRATGPELQDVLGFTMYQGRFCSLQDTADSPPVAVVNRAFANQYSSNGSIINKLKVTLGGKDRQATIVGVMDDFHQSAIQSPSLPEVDFCANQLRQSDGFYQVMVGVHIDLAIRTTRDPETFIPDLRRAMVEMNPDLKDSSFTTMSQVVEDAMGSQLLAAHLLELFAGSALLVALAGLYGLLTYLVTQRTQELGVRLALGAQRTDIVHMLLKQAFWLLAAGAALGVGLAYLSSRVLATFLYGVKPGDLWTLSAVTILLLACGLAAAYVPSRRASRLDPLQALRES